MEEIYSQRFNGAVIEVFRDYCFLDEKTHNTFDCDEDDPFNSVSKVIKKRKKHYSYQSLYPKPKKGKNTSFYYGQESVGENLKFRTSGLISTDKDKHIKKYFLNPYSTITITTYERSIRKHGDTITIKLYYHYKHRRFNQKYFKKRTTVTSLSFNTVTGNFTTLKMDVNRGKQGKIFRKNSFKELYNAIYVICGSHLIGDDNKLGLDVNDTISFLKEIYKTFNIDLFDIGKDLNFYENFLCIGFTKLFSKLKKIKTPNEFIHYIQFYYPTEKFLKKNDRKLIASILDRFKIKSKYTIKLLHENSYINLGLLKIICSYLGENYSKYLPNINSEKFRLSKNYRIDSYNENLGYFIPTDLSNHKLTDIEKENLSHLVNDEYFTLNEGNLLLLRDHFNMIDKLSFYDDTIIMRATNQRDFNEEHSWLSGQIQFIKKGYETTYVFSDKMLKEIEKPYKIEIQADEIGMEGENITGTFYPYVLKTERDYKEEGTFMHHCVYSYTDKSKSVIVSIRTKDKSDRVTCEFDTQTGRLIQARHFSNGKPPADIAMVVDMLVPVAEKLARLGLLNSIEHKKIPIIYNGKQVEIEKRQVILNEPLFLPY